MYTKNEKIGIIGSGIVGQVLASAFLSEGHQVMIGTRNTSKADLVKWKQEHEAGKIGSFADTAAFGEILVLAVDGNVSEAVVNQAGINNFNHKTVIDATNPIVKEAPENGVLKYFTTHDQSLMERIQQTIPSANVVKAFNSVGNAVFYQPNFREGNPTMFICGDNDEAKTTVTAILTAFGWETADMGKAESARAIEPLAILWCIPGFLNNQWTHAFKLLKA